MKTKRTLAFLCVIMLVIALFSGCGSNPAPETTPNETKAPSATQAPASKAPVSEPTETTAPAEDDNGVFYHFAPNDNKNIDANGIATAPYDYQLPITNSDETLSVWTTCWIDFMFDEGGYPASPYPVELEKITGIHIEYDMVGGENRSQNFSVLLASDSLDDIMSGASFFYPGGNFKNAIVEDEYFINIYDYREYCPNYIYQATYNKDDKQTYASVFAEDDLITTFYFMWDQGLVQMNYFFRGDWLEKLGMTNDDIKTFDDLHDALAACKSQFEPCTYPMTYYATLEMKGTYSWNAYDTFFCAGGYGQVYVQDGVVKHANMNDNDKALMTMANQWYNEGLVDPNWGAFSTTQDFNDKIDGQLAYTMMSANGASEHPGCIDPDASVGWVPVTPPLLHEGQTLHLGYDTKRTHYGSSNVSTTCENIPLAVTWIDWRYSTEGATFCTWGVEGVTWEYNEAGERRYNEFYYANTMTSMTMLATAYLCSDITDAGMEYRLDRYAFPGGEESVYAHKYWASVPYDSAYTWPIGLTFTDEERNEINLYSNDVGTYLTENYVAFVDGSASLDTWDSYVEGLRATGMDQILAVYQAAYDDYMAGNR